MFVSAALAIVALKLIDMVSVVFVIGYSATEHSIHYIDLDPGITKVSQHAIFDKSWYTTTMRCTPSSQFLYNLGLQQETQPLNDDILVRVGGP